MEKAMEKIMGASTQPVDIAEKGDHADEPPKRFPKGVVLGPDGKPCRSCTSFASWASMTKQKIKTPASISTTAPPAEETSDLRPPADCPPDVEQLGRASWTLLHSITATYPVRPTPDLQKETKQFIYTFSKLYPCWTCAQDFQRWLKEDRNAPRVSSRDEFGRWMCEAHNAVNVKLGKERFDCDRWEERWRTGWKDGRCD
ncbi:hypothetical protein K432DRAFT_380815 [Lepidopterella palustris CBS 459.81]|uniref:Sulfhydryl oxidase n=1 Tax=Lepidopterella palustris CBS 459.81 TaxID=1314670 RepID=A0A8E2EDW0_9PEZI|nr:hypothetical protein K432DRAFT_380815 [Lepidopterella palustris CBS 459.81]